MSDPELKDGERLDVQLERSSRSSSISSSSTDMFDPFSSSSASSSSHLNPMPTATTLLSTHPFDPPASPSPHTPLSITDWSDLSFPEPPVTSPPPIPSSAAPSPRPALPPSLPKNVPILLSAHTRSASAILSPSSKSSPAPPSITPPLKPPPLPTVASPSNLVRPSSPSASSHTSPLSPPPSSPLPSTPTSTSIPPPHTIARRSSASSTSSSSSSATSPAAHPISPPSLPPLSSSPLSFSVHLLHKPGVIISSIHSTLHSIDSLRLYFKRYSTLQLSIAKQISESASVEYGRMQSTEVTGSGVTSAMLDFYQKMNGAGQAYGVLGQEVSERCCVVLGRCVENGRNMVEVSEKEMKKLNQQMDQAHYTVQKEKETAKQALQALSREREKDTTTPTTQPHDPSPPSSQLSSLKSAFSQLQRRVTHEPNRSSALDQARRKAIRCCEAYQKAVDQANATQQRTWKVALPALIKDLQAQQEMNLTTITNCLTVFGELNGGMQEKVKGLNDELMQTLTGVSVESDIRQFVAQAVDEFGLPVQPDVVKYELPVTAASLKKEEESGGTATPTTSSTLFKNSLDGCMKHDRLSTPLTTEPFSLLTPPLDVPLIIPYLILSIIQHGGLDSEGIFRLSASADTVTSIRQRLEAYDWTALESIDSPHTSAALLKAFLRDLTEPVIPFTLYDRCIELGKGLMVGEKGEEQRGELKDIIQSIPTLNRRVLFHILSFLSVVSSAVHSSTNRMTRTNLSIVFAPSVLRGATVDPVLMLAETKFATPFLCWMMEGFEERKEEWMEEWEWSGREEAGCRGYGWCERRGDGERGVKEEEEEEKEKGGAVLSSAAGGHLPAGWECQMDATTGLPYYFHTETHEVTWVKPVN